MNTTIYTATEQFADFNKANVAQAQKIAALALENAEKLLKLNLNAAKVVLANGAEGAAAAASVKDVQDLMALRAKYAETGVQTATAYTKSLYEISSRSASAIHGARRRSVVDVHEGCRRVGREGQQVGPGRLGTRGQRVQVDVRCFDRRVRPVPEGDEASREPGRCERSRRFRQRGERREGRDEGSQGCVSTCNSAVPVSFSSS